MECDLCAPGKSQPESGAFVCIDCGVGNFSDYEGSTTCATCRAGYYATGNELDRDNVGVASGARACVPCGEGTYSPEDGRIICYGCDVDSGRSSAAGSTSCNLCLAGFYLADDACHSCDDVDGVEDDSCDVGTTVETLRLTDGYWRATDTSTKTELCTFLDDCTGGRPGGGDVLCVGHTKGPKCGLCETGYVSSATTNGKTLGCELCSGTNTRARRAWVSAIIVCALVAAGLLYRHRARVFAAVYDAYGRLNALVVMSKGSRGGLGDVVMNEEDGRSMLATIWNKRSPVS